MTMQVWELTLVGQKIYVRAERWWDVIEYARRKVENPDVVAAPHAQAYDVELEWRGTDAGHHGGTPSGRALWVKEPGKDWERL